LPEKSDEIQAWQRGRGEKIRARQRLKSEYPRPWTLRYVRSDSTPLSRANRLPSAARLLLDRALRSAEVDKDDPVGTDCGVTPMTEVPQLEAELVKQFLPINPGHPKGGPGRRVKSSDVIA